MLSISFELPESAFSSFKKTPLELGIEMKKLFLFILLTFFPICIYSQESTLEYAQSLPNPRKENSSWILDQTKILEASSTKDKLNQVITQLEKDTTQEIAIVILPTIGKLVPKNLATELFQTWSIGKKGKDNGVLILHVLDQRRIEMETGYGMESILPDAICKRLLEENTIPYFKVGAYSVGHESLVRSMDAILRTPNQSYATKVSSISKSLPIPSIAVVDVIPETMMPFVDIEFAIKKRWRIHSIYYLLAGLLLAFLFRYFLYSKLSFWKTKYEDDSKRKEIYIVSSFFIHGLTIILCTVGVGGFLFSFLGSAYLGQIIIFPLFSILVITIGLSVWMFNSWEESLLSAPFLCSKCNAKSVEVKDKKKVLSLLTEVEKYEVEIQSLQYKIFECPKCDNLDKRKSPGIKYHSFTECQKCKCRTAKSSYKTISVATYTQEGLEEITNTCLKCGHISKFQERISKLVETSSDSSSYSSSSSSSNDSSSSSSSSDDFGGGRSGGGGAGSSY